VATPLPALAAEVHQFLKDFWQLKGINIIASQAAFEASVPTPDILPHLSIMRITELIRKKYFWW
jgi:hypothetical protein